MPIRDKVYEKLKSIGLTDSKEDFFNYYDNNENVRKQAYNKLRDAGLTDSEEDFYEYMKPQPSMAQQLRNEGNEPYTHEYDKGMNLVGGTAYEGEPVAVPYSSERASLKEQVADNNRKFPKMEDLPWTKPQGGVNGHLSTNDLASRLNQTYKEGGMEPFLHSNEDKKIKTQYTPKKEEKAEDVWINAANKFSLTERGAQLQSELAQIQDEITNKYLDEFKNSDEYKAYAGQKYTSQAELDEANKVINNLFITKYGEAINNDLQPYQQAYNNEMLARYGVEVESGLNKIAKNEAAVNLGKLSTSVNSELESIEKKIQDRTKAVRNENWKPGMPSSRDDQELARLRGERTYLDGAQELIEDSEHILQAAKDEKDGTFVGGVLRGAGDKLFDVDTWTMGVSDLVGNLRMKNVLEKADKGEKLTKAEEALLDAAVNNMAINAYYRSDLGRGYKAGEVTGESLPFMLEFIINPISSSGNAIAQSLLSYGLKRFGIKTIGKNATKAAARFVGDMAAASGMVATTGMPGVLGETVDRMNRDYKYGVDEDGNLNVIKKGDTSFGEALGKSATTRFLENQSEMIFYAFKGASKMMKGVDEIHPGGINGFMDALKNSKVGQLYLRYKNNPSLKEFRDAAKVGGIGEEYLEEVYNNFANVALGEMSYEDAVSLDKNIDTFLGLAPTQVLFSAWGLGSMAYERHKNRKDMERTFGLMSEEQKRKLEELQKMGKLSHNKDIAFFLRETIADENLTQEEKRAEIEYLYDLAKQNAINDIAEAEVQDQVATENAQIDAATDPQTGLYGEVNLISQDLDGNDIVTPANVFGERVVDGKKHLLVQVEGESERVWVRPTEYDAETYERMPAEEVKAINEEMIRTEAAQQAENESRWHPDVPEPKVGVSFFNGEEEVAIVGIDEQTGGLFVVPSEEYYNAQGNEGKMNKIVSRAMSLGSIPVETYKDAMTEQIESVEKAQKLGDAKIANEDEVVRNGETYTVTNIDDDGVTYSKNDGTTGKVPTNIWKSWVYDQQQAAAPEVVEEKVVEEAAQPIQPTEEVATGNNLSPIEEVAQPQAEVQPQAPVIPTKKDGSIDFVAYGKDNSFKELGNLYGEKMPHKVEVTAKALAEDVIKAQQAVEKAQLALDNAPIGRDSKQKQALEKAQNELAEVQKEADFWNEMDADIKKAQAERESMLNPQAEVNMSEEPMDASEFVAQQLANGNVVLTSESFKKETGYGETERKKFMNIIRKVENGGMTVEQAAEKLVSLDNEGNGNFFGNDTQAARDAIIDMLSSAQTWGNISNYIKNNREAQAAKESEGLREELEEAVMQNYHTTLEDYVLQNEAAEVDNQFKDVDLAQIDAIFAESEEEYQNFINNEQGRTSEVVEGNDNVLSEEQSDNTGRTEGSESEGNSEGIGEQSVSESKTAHSSQQEVTAEEKRRIPLRQRANEWAKALGVKVTFIESIDEVDPITRAQIEAEHAIGNAAPGWVARNGEVFFFMPDLQNINDVNDTYVHEVVAHIGMERLLGKERYAEVCDKVWEMMPQSEKDYYEKEYPGVKEIKDDTTRHRRAADEYIAHLAEKENLTPEEKTIWDEIVKMVRELLDKALNGIIGKAQLTDADISELIKASYANLKSGKTEGGVGEGERFNAKKVSDRRQEKNRMNNTIDQAVALVMGQDVKEAKADRLKREQKRKEDAAEIYESVLSGDFNDVTLQKINDYIDDSTPLNPFGRRISQRLPQKLERKLLEGARTNIVDALFSRISESAVPASRRASEEGRREIEERKKEALKGWAIATNNWYTDLSAFTDEIEPFGEGTDSKVYAAKEDGYVIKTSFGKPMGKRFRPDIDTVVLFNRVFPNSPYEIVGYGEFDGKFARILKQPAIDFAEVAPLTIEERVEYMRSLGFEPINEAKTAFSNGEIIAADIQKSNIVKDAEGNVTVIDADMKLHTKDVGGNYTYPPVEADLPENPHFRVVEDKNGRKSLVGLHNISEEKLKKAIKQGGLANPSMAVIDMDKQAHVDYGDITLVAPSSLIDKKTGKNIGTYTADAWTPIYPQVEKQMNENGVKEYNKALEQVPSELRSKVRLYFNDYLKDGDTSDAMYYWFLQDTGKNPPLLSAKSSEYTEAELNSIEAISNAGYYSALNEEEKKKVLELYIEKQGGKEAFEEKIAERVETMKNNLQRTDIKQFVKKKVEQKLKDIEEYGYDYDKVSDFYSGAQRAINTRGKVDEWVTFRNAKDVVNNEGLQQEFDKWLSDKEDQFGVEEKLFVGYTNKGDRKYLPNTLENASKLMKKEGRAGATGLYGFNHFVATLAPNAASLAQINKKKGNLSTQEEYKEFVDKWGSVYHDLAQVLRGNYDGYSDVGYYRLEEMPTVKNPKDYVKKEYGIELSDEFMQKYNDFVSAIKNDFPARYFETKFERPVYLNEFAAAVVPQGTSKDVVDALTEAGLPVEEYEVGNNEARMAAVDKVASETDGIRFRISPKGKQIQEEVDKFTSKYASKPVVVMEKSISDNEKIEAFDNLVKLEEINKWIAKAKAAYVRDNGKIYIFADNVESKDVEQSLFHENIHANIEDFADFRDKLWERMKDIPSERIEHIKSKYKEDKWPEEFLAYTIALAQQEGYLGEVAPHLDEAELNELIGLLNKYGYDYAKEYDERRRTSSSKENGEGRSENGGRVRTTGNNDKGISGESEQEERINPRERAERLKELFDKVADMGLEGVLGNGHYNKAMMDIYRELPEEARKIVADDALSSKGIDFIKAMDRFLNEKAEPSIWDKVTSVVREWLRKAGFNLELTPNEVKYIWWRSQKPLDRSNVIQIAEDTYKKYQLKVGEFEDSPNPDGDGGGTRFRSKKKAEPIDIADERPQIIKEYDDALKTNMFNFQEAFQDRMLSVKVLMDKIVDATGKAVRSFEDVYKAENQLSSKNKEDQKRYEEKFYKPLIDELKELSDKYSHEEVRRYIYCKSGLERNEVLRQRDADEAYEESKAELDEKLAKGNITQAQYNVLLQQADQQRTDTLSKDIDYSGIRGMLVNARVAEVEKEYQEGRIDKQTRDTRINGIKANKQQIIKGWKKFAEDQVHNLEQKASQQELDALWDKINAATNETLRIDFESGMIDRDTYNAEKNMMKYYVPLRNWSNTTAEDMYEYRHDLTPAVSSNQKRAEGRMSEANNPIATIGLMAQNAIVRGNRNKMKQKLYAFVANRETPLASIRDVWYIRDANNQWVPQYADTSNAQSEAEVQQIMDQFEQNMEALAAQGDAFKGKLKFGMGFRANRSQKNEHVVTVMVNGKEYGIYVNGNPRAAQAVNGQTNAEGIDDGFVWVDKLKRLYGGGLTSWNPDFIVPNLVRDTIHASTMTFLDRGVMDSLKYMANIPRIFTQVFAEVSGLGTGNAKLHQYFEEFVKNGGETGYTAIQTLEDYKKEYNKLMDEAKGVKSSIKKGAKIPFEKIAKLLEAANRIAEDVNRFNAFVTAREAGENIVNSVDAAKNITVNFNRKGALHANNTVFGKIASFMSRWILFFNPSVQGIYQFVTKSKVNPKRAAFLGSTIMASGFFAPLINEMLIALMGGDDEDDYWNQSDYKRRNNWMIFTGNGYVSIPLPPVLREIYGMGDIIYGVVTGHIPPQRAVYDIAKQMQNAVGMINVLPEMSEEPEMITTLKGFAPDLVAPIVDIATNSNFMGRPIAKWTDFNESDPEYMRVYKGTSRHWIELSKFINEAGGNEVRRSDWSGDFINPAMMEHLFTSYTGGIGKTINNFVGMITDYVTDNKENIDFFRKAPIVPRFYTPNDERTVVPAINRKYYEFNYQYNNATKALKKAKDGVQSGEHPEWQKYIDEMEKNGETEFIKYFKAEQKRLKKIQDRLKDDPNNKELQQKEIDKKAEIATKSLEILR